MPPRLEEEHSRRHQSHRLSASMPNRLLCCVVRAGTSWGNDAWQLAVVVVKSEEEEQVVTISTTGKFTYPPIMMFAVVLLPPWGPTPSF